MSVTPQLLISVANLSEASIVQAAGVRLIDIKNPDAGSLGKAESRLIAEICNALANANITLSAALGELATWKPADTENLPENLTYLKMGLSGMRDLSAWQDRWCAAQKTIQKQKPHLNATWIAVAYVDADLAHAPCIEEVIEAAKLLNCGGILFDTYHKSNKRFFDYMTIPQLSAHLNTIHTANMLCAVAGRLQLEDIPHILKAQPDILALRSAACEQHNRQSGICSDALKNVIRTFQDHQ